MKCVIGIDGGGTKTLLRMTDFARNVLFEQSGGPANICASPEAEVEKTLAELLNASLAAIPEDGALFSVCMGSAGVVAEENRACLARIIQNATGCPRIRVENDAYTALYANLEDGVGISLTAGTGSICVGQNANGVFARTGGWGHLFSDEGSAYAMAIAALRRSFYGLDGRGPETRLLSDLMTACDSASPQDLISKIYLESNNKKQIANLSLLVYHAAQAGDPVACQIIEDAAEELFVLCETVAKKLEMKKFTVVQNGGLLLKNALVRGAFNRRMQLNFPACTILPAVRDAAWGAIQVALEANEN